MSQNCCFSAFYLPVSQRTPPKPCFLRVIGRDAAGESARFLSQVHTLADRNGVYLKDGVANPTEPEIRRFYDLVGERFVLSGALIRRHMTMWLGQLRPEQREALTLALEQTLERLRSRGANDGVLRNAYIKFMCWFRGAFGHALTGLLRDVPPCILAEGELSKYDFYVLWLLHQAGCDVVYANPVSDASYRKQDPEGSCSILWQGELLTPEPQSAPPRPAQPRPAPVPPRPAPSPSRTVSSQPRPAQARPSPPPLGPAPWEGMGNTLCINRWADGQAVTEAVLLPASRRGKDGHMDTLFALCFGGDERSAYRTRLFRLRRALEQSPKRWKLLEGAAPPPTPAEVQRFQTVDKTLPGVHLIRAIAGALALNCGKVPQLLAQRAFTLAMESAAETNSVRLYNHGVRLACWMRRYLEPLFEGYDPEQLPALVCYGPVNEATVTLLWAVAHSGVDVLYFSPQKAGQTLFEASPLSHDWSEVVMEQDLPAEPFPQKEELLRASTTAYNAAREIDEMLHNDVGMFRTRSFPRSAAVTLRTTYDEVLQLWKEEAQFRPSFQTQGDTVHVPNLFAKINGVEGNVSDYWDTIRGLITPETHLITNVPFLVDPAPVMSIPKARAFFHNGRLDPVALKRSEQYRYGFLPDDTQNYMLEKMQTLIDCGLITDGGRDLPACVLSTLMGLSKDTLHTIQSFDFTRTIPKVVIVDVTDRVFSLAECILLGFFNLVGFDIAVFTPTGYRNLEAHLNPDAFQTLNAGEYRFDLTVPSLRGGRRGSGEWFSRLFGGN